MDGRRWIQRWTLDTTLDAGKDAGENAGRETQVRSPDMRRTQEAAQDTTLDALRWTPHGMLDTERDAGQRVVTQMSTFPCLMGNGSRNSPKSR